MGLTIHWSLHSNTRSPKKARELVAQLRGRALDLPFENVGDLVELTGTECDFETRDQDDPYRWLLIQAGQYVDREARGGGTHSFQVAPTHLLAFETQPGPGCEPANFGLCRYRRAVLEWWRAALTKKVKALGGFHAVDCSMNCNILKLRYWLSKPANDRTRPEVHARFFF